MRLALVILCLALAAPASVLAQESACAAIENDAERLACYDRANGRVPRAAPQLPPPPAAPVPQAAAERSLLPSFSGIFADTPEPLEAPMPMQVAGVQRRASGQMLLLMTNDEVWAPLETPERMPRTGEQVSIQRRAVGLFVLTPQTGAPFRVRKQ